MSSSLTIDVPIIWRTDNPSAEYEAARTRVFNTNCPDRFPRAIVRPRGVEHIIAAIKLAEKLDCRVSIRSGGHSWACWSVRQDAILIDLVDFHHLSYDAENDVVEASPATMSKQLCEFLRSKGRFTPAGHCGDVGLGGFLLQGGMGLNARGFGWSCQFVLAIDVVTADGELKHCSKEMNSDLFWVARGAGPGFPGVITRFYLKTMKAFPVHKRSLYIYPISEYEAVMKWLLQALPSLHRDVEPILHISNTATEGYKIATIFSALAVSEEEAREKLKPLANSRPTGAMVCDEYMPTSFKAEYEFGEQAMPGGRRWVADNVYVDPSADLLEVCRKSFTSLPVDGIAYWEPMNPVSQEPLEDMALSLQTDHYVALYAAYRDPKEDAFHQSWVREYIGTLEPYAVGAYLGDADFQQRSTKFWSEEAGKKLMAIRRKYDPQGRICGYLDKHDRSGVDGLPNILSGIAHARI